MEIDWVTVSAQVVNFLILVGLLTRFLYRPVLEAMDRRESLIAKRLGDAESRRQQADARAAEYERKVGALADERSQLLAESRREASRFRSEMLQELQGESARLREGWQAQVLEERDAFLQRLRQESVSIITAALDKALRDLADVELQDRMVQRVALRLEALDSASLEALRQPSEPVQVVSAFELRPKSRARLNQALAVALNGGEVEYKEDPKLVCGIELSRNGRRLSWNVKSYLEELESRVHPAFQHEVGPEGRG